jgi:hypothetical protein
MSIDESLCPPQIGVVHRDRGAAGHERPVDADGREHPEIVLIGSVCDRVADAILLQCLDPRTGGIGAILEVFVAYQPDAMRRLLLQHAHEVRVAHRRQWVEALRRFRNDLFEGEEVALKHRALHLRKSRTEGREVRPQSLGQKIGARADVAMARRIEGRAVLEEQLSRLGGREQIGRPRKDPHRLILRRDAGLEPDDDRFDVCQLLFSGKARQHPRADARAHEHGGEFEAPGEIVGDGSE